MLRKLCGGVLIVLVLVPCTAPFSAFDMSDLSDSGAGDFAAAVCPMSAPATAVHLAASVVPPLLTKSGRLRIDVTPQSGNAIVVIAPSPSIRQTLQIGQSRQSSFIKLRL